MNTSVDSISSDHSIHSMLEHARLINSDIGRHSVNCIFSTRLTGRFYQNSSLERHTARRSRLADMQSKKKRLEKELMIEEQRINLLEERLIEAKRARNNADVIISKIEKGILKFQALIRRNQTMDRFIQMKYNSRMTKYIALFLQSRYRGIKAREHAESIRRALKHKKINEAATLIESVVRGRIQRKHYIDVMFKMKMLRNRSAVAIQALFRGKVARLIYQELNRRRIYSALTIQRIYRGKIGRLKAISKRQMLLKKRDDKPKRVPLHLRRYSTYAVAATRLKETKKSNINRERNSSTDILTKRMDGKSLGSSAVHESDENDSIASTLTSLSPITDVSHRNSAHKRVSRNIKSQTSMPKVVVNQNTTHERKLKSMSSMGSIGERSSRRTKNCMSTTNRSVSKNTGRTKCQLKQTDIPTIAGGHLSSPFSETQQASNHSRQNKASYEIEKFSGHFLVESKCIDAESTCVAIRDVGNGQICTQSQTQVQLVIPVTITTEAALIVKEVLGSTIMTHSIMSSTFDDKCSEHEDDLE